MPEGTSKVAGLKIHGSRYGQPQPPRESFLIYFMSLDLKRILHTEMAAYSLFKRGGSEWVAVPFDPPVAGLPTTFWVVLDFRAAPTKGVYVSYDTSTGGHSSRVGLPGMPTSEVGFGGDWMIQADFVP
jgi:RNA polymerase sigma-70 factor (ECF subfamily)